MFQKGHPGYNKGLDPEILQARKLNKLELERCVNKYLYMTAGELVACQKDPNTLMIDHLIISLIAKATKEGDYKRLSMLLDRMIGSVQQNVVVQPPPPPKEPEGVLIDLEKMSPEALKELLYAGSSTAK